MRFLLAFLLLAAGSAFAYNNGLTGSVIHSQVHNASPWTHSATLTRPAAGHLRVNNGAGWTETTQTYNYGQALSSYEMISRGSCTTASSGGPSGTGSDITDGTCHWKYVGPVDYVTATGWMYDNAAWTARTYTPGDFVRVGTLIYTYYPDNPGCPGCGGQTTPSCASTVAPTGTANAGPDRNFAAADGCKWHYQTDIVYSSGVSHIPTATAAHTVYNMTANYQGDLWNDREYVVGANGEAGSFGPNGHNAYGDGVFNIDGTPPCRFGCFHIVIAAAPGESFADRLTQYSPLTGYDQTQGVAIRNPTNSRFGTAVLPLDSYVDLVGLQVKSDFAGAYDGLNVHSNNNTIQTCVLEGAGDPFVVEFDFGPSTIANSLVISHSNSGGIFSKYPAVIIHNTVAQPPGQSAITNSTGIANNGTLHSTPPTPVSNNAVFGFAHAASFFAGGTDGNVFSTTSSSRNATDSAATDSGSVFVATLSATFQVTPLPGVNNLFSVAPAGVFVNWATSGSDYRLRSTSPLRGQGAAFGNFSTDTTYNFDDLNLIRRQRPQAGRWDVGAW